MKSKICAFGSILALAGLLLVASCEEKQIVFSLQDTENVSEEASVESYYQDLDDLGNVALATPTEPEYSGGRRSATITVSDNRFCNGVVVTVTPGATSTANAPNGVITIDFGQGAGCTDQRGTVRKGKVILSYQGLRFQPNSSVVVTTENYTVNGIRLEGTRTTTNITGSTLDAPKFNVVLANGKATFTDGTFATRVANITASWIRAANPLNDKLVIHNNSTASGVTRNGTTYEVSLGQQLEYQRFCPIAVSGVKNYRINSSRDISINYGDGACDKSFVVTSGAFTRTVTLD